MEIDKDIISVGINVIIFLGVREGPDYYSRCFAEYLKSRSVDYYIADAGEPETYLCSEFDDFASRPNTVMFTINNVGLMLRVEGGNYWKKYCIPVFDYIVDHPRNYYDSMLHPECDLYVFTLDKDHKAFIDRFYPEVKMSFFSPNGGTEINIQEKYQQREIDVLYMGNCNAASLFPVCREFEDGGKDFYGVVSAHLMNDPMLSAEEAIEAYFRDKGKAVSEEELLLLNTGYAGYIEGQVRRHFKLEGIKALDDEGVHVDVFGDGWEDDDYHFSDNISLHERIEVEKMMDLIGRSKISLCFIPWYKKGCSEKNFDSMLNGALCVTDRSEYLDENYRDGYNIIYFDLNNPKQMAADVKWLLNNPYEAEIIARRGYYTARKNDTWNCRFDKVIEVMKDVVSHSGESE